MRNLASLVLLSLVVGYTAWQGGGMLRLPWLYALAALAFTAILLFGPARGQVFAPSPHRWTMAVIIALPGYILLQVVPLPFAWIAALSPHRAELTRQAGAILGHTPAWIPLSVAPFATLDHLPRVLACMLIFFTVRELGWRLVATPWTIAAPLIAIATLEAAFGFRQLATGASPMVVGTYVNRNHFAGLLVIALPFAVVGAISLLSGLQPRQTVTIRRGLGICGMLGTVMMIAAGLLYSVSRGGLAAGLAATLVLALLGGSGRGSGVRTGWRTFYRTLMVGALLGIAMLPAIPPVLLERFGQAPQTAGTTGEEMATEARLGIWRETTHLIRAYPVFGSGFGTYGSAIEEFRKTEPLYLLEYAHNDYLQWASELGLPGIVLLLAGGARLAGKTILLATGGLTAPHRFVMAACAASLCAMALMELWDFHSYIPANALSMAWVAGIAAAGDFAPRLDMHGELGVPRVVDLTIEGDL